MCKIKFYDVKQNSVEWDELRRGRFTSSVFSNLTAGKDTKTYKNAIIKVAYERVTGESEESFSNKWTQRGHEREPFAKENYELITFNEVENGGFYLYNDFVGASPDGKIKRLNGGVEFKCPSFQIYNEYLRTRKIPLGYFLQIHGQMLCAGWDFVDYFPFSHPNLKPILVRVERDETVLRELRERLDESIRDVEILINQIKNE